MKGLRHPNLIRFLQAIETTHRFVNLLYSSNKQKSTSHNNYKYFVFSVYIIMEYAQNGSLLDIIRLDTFIDEFRSRRWFRQLLEAIDYCHGRGVVHR